MWDLFSMPTSGNLIRMWGALGLIYMSVTAQLRRQQRRSTATEKRSDPQ